MKHERRVVGHVSGWQEQMNTCVCGKPWPCPDLQQPSQWIAYKPGDRLPDVEYYWVIFSPGFYFHGAVRPSIAQQRDGCLCDDGMSIDRMVTHYIPIATPELPAMAKAEEIIERYPNTLKDLSK